METHQRKVVCNGFYGKLVAPLLGALRTIWVARLRARRVGLWAPSLALVLALIQVACVPQAVEGRARWADISDMAFQLVQGETLLAQDTHAVAGRQVQFKAWSNIAIWQRDDLSAFTGIFTTPSLRVFGMDVNPVGRMSPQEFARYLVDLSPTLLRPLGLDGHINLSPRREAMLATPLGTLNGVEMQAQAGDVAARVLVYLGKAGADHFALGVALPLTASDAEVARTAENLGKALVYPAGPPQPGRWPLGAGTAPKGATLSFYPFNPTKEVMDDLHVLVSGPCVNITSSSSDRFTQSTTENTTHNGKGACKISFDKGKVPAGQSASVEIQTADVKPVPQIIGFYWTQGGKQVGTFKDNTRDSDRDGLPDWYEEEVTGTKPKNADSDGDKTPDGREDNDGDGLNNGQEYGNGTNPNGPDTDGDGVNDDTDTAPRDPNKK